jgi:hypothetical protein
LASFFVCHHFIPYITSSHHADYFFLLAFFLPLDFFFRLPAFFFGTFAPERRASDSPMAIACLRLVTFFPDRPLLSLPRFRSCIALSTFLDAFLL